MARRRSGTFVAVSGAFLHPFARPTRDRFITLTRGDGARVWDADGKEYVDGMASLWYCAIGHGRAEMAEAIAAQAGTLAAYSCFDPFTNAPADELAEKLSSHGADPRRPRVLLPVGVGSGRHGDEAGAA